MDADGARPVLGRPEPPRSNYPPRTLGSAASPLLKLLDGSHYDAKLTPQERTMVRLWIDSGAPYAGTYAALGTGMIGSYREDILDRSDTNWPAVKAAQAVLRSAARHATPGHGNCRIRPPTTSACPPGKVTSADPRTRFSRHILYNLTRPEKSLLLLAPLAKEAGGYGICGATGHRTTAVFAGTDDPDYRLLLESVLAAQRPSRG